MPIDASIYQGATLANPAGAFLQGMQLAQQQREHQQTLQLRQQEGAALNEQRQAVAEQRQLAIAKAERDAAEEAKLREVFSSGQVSPGTVFSIVGPQRGAEILKGLAALQEQNQKAFTSTQQIVGTVIPAIKALPEGLRPDAYTSARTNLISRGVVKPEDVPEQYDPTFLDQAHQWALTPEQQYAEQHPKLTEHDPTKDLITPTGEVKVKGTGPKPPNSQESDFLLDGKVVKGDYVPGTSGTGGKYFYQGQDVTGRAQAKPTASATSAGDTQDEAKAIADAIARGDQPPELTGLYRFAGPVRAELAKRGYDFTKASLDWQATKKHLASLNGAQQLRLNQAINALPEMLDSVDDLASKWKGGRFPILNKANLALAKGGAFGSDVASIANQLSAQIADVTADLGNVYMGGNSPTDHALGLAGQSLKGEWDEKVLHDMVALAKKNVTIRRNSINTTGVAGASADNAYAPTAPPIEPAAAPKTEPATGVPANVSAALTGQKPGKYTLSDGSVWLVQAGGSILKAR